MNIRCVKRIINEDDKSAFKYSFFLYLMVHFFVFVGHYPTYGGINAFIKDPQAAINESRWFAAVIIFCDGRVTMPGLLGIISCFFWAATCTCLVKFFAIKEKTNVLGITALFISFPVIAGMNCFLYMADIFSISSFLCCLGTLLWKYNTDNSKKRIVLVVVCYTLSIATYQPILSLAYVVILIDIIIGVSECQSIKKFGAKILELLVEVLISFLGWFLVDKIIHIFISNSSPISELDLSFKSIFNGIINCYKGTYWFLFSSTFLSRISGRIIVFSSILLSILLLALWLYKNRKSGSIWLKTICVFFLICAYPILANYTFIVIPNTSMVYRLFLAQIGIFIFPLILQEKISSNSCKEHQELTSLLCFASKKCVFVLACIGFIFFAEVDNTAYTNAYIQYEKEYSLAIRIVDRIESTPGYEMGMPVMVIVNDNYVYNGDIMESLLDGYIPNMEQEGGYIMYNFLGIKNFISEFIQTNMFFEWCPVDDSLIERLGVWPSVNCIMIEDGKAYIRLS